MDILLPCTFLLLHFMFNLIFSGQPRLSLTLRTQPLPTSKPTMMELQKIELWSMDKRPDDGLRETSSGFICEDYGRGETSRRGTCAWRERTNIKLNSSNKKFGASWNSTDLVSPPTVFCLHWVLIAVL